MNTILEQCELNRLTKEVVPDIIENLYLLKMVSISENPKRAGKLSWFSSVREMLNEARRTKRLLISRKLNRNKVIDLTFYQEVIKDKTATGCTLADIYEEVDTYRNGLASKYYLDFCAKFNKDEDCKPFDGNVRKFLDEAKESPLSVYRRLNNKVILIAKITNQEI